MEVEELPFDAHHLARPDLTEVLRPRAGALDAALDRLASPATRSLSVSLLEAILDEVHGLDAAGVAMGHSLTYVKDVAEAIDAADRQAGTAYLLDATKAEDVLRVARAGELMLQKSTYFSPKPATGLLFAPGEW